jgi:lipoate-protein ligase B
MSGVIPKADYTGYLGRLEQVLFDSLEHFGIRGERLKDLTGVWVNRSKIAAIGVKVDARGITRHGFALNITPDMRYWDGIIGCGLQGYTPTSMVEILRSAPPMEEVIRAVVNSFEGVFKVKCQWIT